VFPGKDNALQPLNRLHIPIGYHGQSSSVYPSVAGGIKDVSSGRGDSAGGDETKIMITVCRPCGQLQIGLLDPNRDINGENSGRPITIVQARDCILGSCPLERLVGKEYKNGSTFHLVRSPQKTLPQLLAPGS